MPVDTVSNNKTKTEKRDRGVYNLREEASIFLFSTRIEAARCDNFKVLFPFFQDQFAGCRGIISQLISWIGRFRWKDLTAARTPFSTFIFSAIFCAAIRVSGAMHMLIAFESEATLRDLWSIGRGPAPAAATMFAQNGWLHIVSHSQV